MANKLVHAPLLLPLPCKYKYLNLRHFPTREEDERNESRVETINMEVSDVALRVEQMATTTKYFSYHVSNVNCQRILLLTKT